MQFGYCVSMIAKDAEGIGYGWIERLKKAGYDYIELPLAQMSTMEASAIQEKVIKPMQDQGLPCLTMNNFFPSSYRLTGPYANHSEALAYAEYALDLAASLGAKVVVFGSSGARNVPDGANPEACFQQLIEFLRELSSIAQKHKVEIAIEHLNRLEANLINTFSEGMALAKATHAPGIGVLADYYHMRMVSEPFCEVATAGALLKHVHIARTLNRETPRSGDMEPYAPFFEGLSSMGYQGTVSVEAYAEQERGDIYIREALVTLKSFQRDKRMD